MVAEFKYGRRIRLHSIPANDKWSEIRLHGVPANEKACKIRLHNASANEKRIAANEK